MSELGRHTNHLHVKREETFIVWQRLVRKETLLCGDYYVPVSL